MNILNDCSNASPISSISVIFRSREISVSCLLSIWQRSEDRRLQGSLVERAGQFRNLRIPSQFHGSPHRLGSSSMIWQAQRRLCARCRASISSANLWFVAFSLAVLGNKLLPFQRLAYSKNKSDLVAMADGTYVPRPKRKVEGKGCAVGVALTAQ